MLRAKGASGSGRLLPSRGGGHMPNRRFGLVRDKV
jgi:hypothetical protein